MINLNQFKFPADSMCPPKDEFQQHREIMKEELLKAKQKARLMKKEERMEKKRERKKRIMEL